MDKVDVLVIGAGVVGLAIGRAFALQKREVIVAEREKIPGSATSSRNSGVIHAGIYYPKHSNKARLCINGKNQLYHYAKERNISYQNCTKLIVACTPNEISTLKAIQQKALDNGVDDLQILSQEESLALEPELFCHGALLSPSTGIIDVHALMQEFITDIEEYGGIIAYDNPIHAIHITPNGFEVIFPDGNKILARILINAAGLEAQNIAKSIKGLTPSTIPKAYHAKGNYFGLTGKTPFSRLIYPVPVQGGLGAHFTINIAGESLFGPDVEWMKEGSSLDFTVNPERSQSFYDSISRFWPAVTTRELFPAYAGIRPKISSANMPDGDFIIQGEQQHGIKGLVNLYGIESPGLTASMSIGSEVQGLIHQQGLASS